jgi:hypothetical protein
LWFIVVGRTTVGCCRGRVEGVCAVELFVEVLAGGDCLTAMVGGLLLQPLGLGCLDVGFGLSGAGFGGGLLGARFALHDLSTFFTGLTADGFGFGVAVVIALVAGHPAENT